MLRRLRVGWEVRKTQVSIFYERSERAREKERKRRKGKEEKDSREVCQSLKVLCYIFKVSFSGHVCVMQFNFPVNFDLSGILARGMHQEHLINVMSKFNLMSE